MRKNHLHPTSITFYHLHHSSLKFITYTPWSTKHYHYTPLPKITVQFMSGKWSEVENRSNIPSILWRQNSLHYCSIYQSTRLEETYVLPHLSPFHFLLHSPSHSLHSLPPYIRPKGPKPKLTPSLTYSTITRQVAFKALH